MKNKRLPVVALLLLLVVMFNCNSREERTLSIRLRWVKAYPAETWNDVRTGLLWSLSFLGAGLPAENADSLITRKDSSAFLLNLAFAGFNKEAQPVLMDILDSLKASEEYRSKGAIDVGRFIMVTEGASRNYYAITGVAETYAAFRERHPARNEKVFHLRVSSVSDHERRIRFSPAVQSGQIAFVAEEGTGSCDSGSFRVTDYETFDLMPNGQLRFAVYDAGGKLIDGSPAAIGKAGKPGKCLWCHELNVQKLFIPSPEPARGITTSAFVAYVDSAQQLMEAYRRTLRPMIFFEHRQDHTYSELLYISFMEPSALRISSEWGVDPVAVKHVFEKQATHVYAEFPFLGNSWYRYYVDSVAAYRSLPVPLSMREPYGKEPVYFSPHR